MFNQKGALTLSDITTQNESWSKTIQVVDKCQKEIVSFFVKEAFTQLVFIGAGSSLNAASVCSRFFMDMTGVPAVCIPPSELFSGLRLPFDERRKTLAVVLTRSGETSETLWALQRFQRHPAVRTLVITPAAESQAAKLAHMRLLIPHAAEETHVSTKAYTSSIFAFKYLIAFLMKNTPLYNEMRQLPEKFQAKKFQKEIQRITGVKPQNVIASGNGIMYGHACEASAIISKMAAIPTSALYSTQLRYGLASYATPNTLAIVFSGDAMRKAVGVVAGDLAATKCHRLVICDKADQRLGTCEFVAELGCGLSENVRDLLMIEVVQELGFYMAVQKGVNADKPKHVPFSVSWKEPYFNK